MSLVRNVNLHDASGNPVGSLENALNIHDADVHNSIVNRYLHQHTLVATTLSVPTVGDGTEYTITVNLAVGFLPGDYIHIGNGTSETTHPRIISVLGNVLTLDRRLDLAHAVGTPVVQAIIDMATTGLIGTMATPQIFYASPYGNDVWHLTRVLFAMAHNSAGDLGLFGNLPSLLNGVIIRVRVSGQYFTFSNWKNNGDMKVDMGDVSFDPRSGGGGNYGTSGEGSFKSAGSVIRLDAAQGDRIELIVQDDITALGFFTMKVQGHLEVV